jgi:hypothetical protein
MEHYSNFPLSKIAIPGFAGGTPLLHSFTTQIVDILSRHLGLTSWRRSQLADNLRLYLREPIELTGDPNYDYRREGTLDIQHSAEEQTMAFPEDLLRKLKVIDPNDEVTPHMDFINTVSRKLNTRDYARYGDAISVGPPFHTKRFLDLQYPLMADTYITVRATADLPSDPPLQTLRNQVQTTIRALNEFFSKEARNENQIVWVFDDYGEHDFDYRMEFSAGILVHDRDFSETDRFNFEAGDLVKVRMPDLRPFFALYLGDGRVRRLTGRSNQPLGRVYRPLPHQIVPVSSEEVPPHYRTLDS